MSKQRGTTQTTVNAKRGTTHTTINVKKGEQRRPLQMPKQRGTTHTTVTAKTKGDNSYHCYCQNKGGTMKTTVNAIKVKKGNN